MAAILFSPLRLPHSSPLLLLLLLLLLCLSSPLLPVCTAQSLGNNVSLVTLTTAGPFQPRQQGGLYATNSSVSGVVTVTGTVTASPGSLVIYGGLDNGAPTNDVWLVTSPAAALPTGFYSLGNNTGLNSESYGPACCTDPYQQILYSVGGDLSGGDTSGTNAVWYSTNLGQSWGSLAAPFPGRGNSVCFVDSYSRLYVVGGKWPASNGTLVSHDVWQGVMSTGGQPSTLSFTLQSGAPPFSPRDGFSGASYYSSTLVQDILYVGSGYGYNSLLAAQGDNGVGYNDLWASSNQGQSWSLVTIAPYPTRYHARLLATQSGILVMLAGANEQLPVAGGSSQISSVLLNDMWASLDGGFTWGQCSSQLFPPYQNQSLPYARGTGREDPLAAIDPVTGFLYTGAGLARSQSGAGVFISDLYRTSIAFNSPATVAAACGVQTIPAATGMQVWPHHVSDCPDQHASLLSPSAGRTGRSQFQRQRRGDRDRHPDCHSRLSLHLGRPQQRRAHDRPLAGDQPGFVSARVQFHHQHHCLQQ